MHNDFTVAAHGCEMHWLVSRGWKNCRTGIAGRWEIFHRSHVLSKDLHADVKLKGYNIQYN